MFLETSLNNPPLDQLSSNKFDLNKTFRKKRSSSHFCKTLYSIDYSVLFIALPANLAPREEVPLHDVKAWLWQSLLDGGKHMGYVAYYTKSLSSFKAAKSKLDGLVRSLKRK